MLLTGSPIVLDAVVKTLPGRLNTLRTNAHEESDSVDSATRERVKKRFLFMVSAI